MSLGWCTTWWSLSLALQPMTFGSVYRCLLFRTLFVLGKMSFPTIVRSLLHKFPIKELSYYTVWLKVPQRGHKLLCCCRGGVGRARGTHSCAESGLNKGSQRSPLQRVVLLPSFKGSELYLAWKQLKRNTGWLTFTNSNAGKKWMWNCRVRIFLLVVTAAPFIYRDSVNVMNYYTNEDSFHVSAKDRITVQGKVQNF